MKRLLGSVVVVVLASTVVPLATTAASADVRVVDSYCSPSGDFCTFVSRSDAGAIVFEIHAAANYFQRAQACVSKRTTECRSKRPDRFGPIYVWRLRWQGNFPNQGKGRYEVQWSGQNGDEIGRQLVFHRRRLHGEAPGHSCPRPKYCGSTTLLAA